MVFPRRPAAVIPAAFVTPSALAEEANRNWKRPRTSPETDSRPPLARPPRSREFVRGRFRFFSGRDKRHLQVGAVEAARDLLLFPLLGGDDPDLQGAGRDLVG